ncbi:hypothetical protein D3C72_1588310 [compost metagenome]
MVRRGLGGRIRTVRRIGRSFGELGIAGAKRAKNFIRGDVQEAEPRPGLDIKSGPVSPHRLEQCKCADDIRLDKIGRSVNGAVHVAFRSKMQDRAGAILGQQDVECSAVADVRPRKNMTRIVGQRSEGLQIAGVCQLVDVDNTVCSRLTEPVEDKIGADKPCPARNHYVRQNPAPCLSIFFECPATAGAPPHPFQDGGLLIPCGGDGILSEQPAPLWPDPQLFVASCNLRRKRLRGNADMPLFP